jgi:hypothetical protein
MKRFTGQIKLIAEREIHLQLNYCKIPETFQKYFEGILNFSLCFKFLVSQTPLPHKISCGTSKDLLESSSLETLF